MGLALLGLASCAKHVHAPVVAVAPPAPVGHVYPTFVQVPPSTSKRIKTTLAQQEALQQAFNVIGLKSALMVGALSCSMQDKYDTFVTTFQPHILAEQHVMDAYFRRTGGHHSQADEDSFVTLLANNQSVGGLAQGAVFCLNNQAEFNAVLTLKSPEALDAFVTDQAPSSTSSTVATTSRP